MVRYVALCFVYFISPNSFPFLYSCQLIAGYGLTETSPVICNQLVEHKVLGCIGEFVFCCNLLLVLVLILLLGSLAFCLSF